MKAASNKRAVVTLVTPTQILREGKEVDVEDRVDGLVIELSAAGVIVAPFHTDKERDPRFVFAPQFHPMHDVKEILFLDKF